MKGRRGERGSILVTSAVAMSSLILMAGLVIDISHFYVVKTELQNAVDAAALAGASGLNGEQSGIETAVCRAVTTLNSNKYGFNNKQFVPGVNPSCETLKGSLGQYVRFGADSDFPFEPAAAAFEGWGRSYDDPDLNPLDVNFVRVAAPDVTVPIFFAYILGSSRSIEAEATAGLSPSSNVLCDLAPFAVVECDDPSALGCSLAAAPATQVFTAGGALCPSQTRFTKGCVYTIKPGVNGSEGPARGSYQLLAMNSNSVSAAVAGAVNRCLQPSHCVRINADTVSGSVAEGINTRFDGTGADTNVAEGITHDEYLINTVNRPNRRREVLVPIIGRSQLAGRTGVVAVCGWGIGRFFIQGRAASSSNEITVEYIGRPTVSGRGGFVPEIGTGNPDFVMPVLYR